MQNPFKRVNLYVTLSTNKIDLINLNTGEGMTQYSKKSFSSDRLLVADFNVACALLRSMTKDMNVDRNRLYILVHYLEDYGGGVSESEKRILRDLGEMLGAAKVILHTDFSRLSNDAAAEILESS